LTSYTDEENIKQKANVLIRIKVDLRRYTLILKAKTVIRITVIY